MLQLLPVHGFASRGYRERKYRRTDVFAGIDLLLAQNQTVALHEAPEFSSGLRYRHAEAHPRRGNRGDRRFTFNVFDATLFTCFNDFHQLIQCIQAWEIPYIGMSWMRIS